MEALSLWPIAATVIIVGAVLQFVAMHALESQMSSKSKSTEIPRLSPVELAYLLRRGDMTHCIVVLAVDLVQKTVKGKDCTMADSTAAYTQQLGTAVKNYVTARAGQRAREMIEPRSLKSVPGIFRGISRLHLFFTERFRPLVEEVIKDPRNLRRYFNPAGILRLALDIYASGIKVALERDLQAELTRRALLAGDDERRRCATRLRALSSLSLIFMVAALSIFFQPQYLAVIILSFGAVCNGLLLRLLLAARGFLPFYREVALVLGSVKRTGLRIKLVRLLFGSARAIFTVVTGLILAICFGLQLLILGTQGDFLSVGAAALLLLLCSLHAFFCADGIARSLSVERSPQLTISGSVAVRHYKKGLACLSPVTVMNETFTAPEYDERLAMLVSIYVSKPSGSSLKP